MRHYGWLLVPTALLGFASSLLIAGDAAKETRARKGATDDLAWARKVATDFLELATSNSPAEAMGLLSPELSRALQAQPHTANVLDWITDQGLQNLWIASEEVSPNGSEIIFTGLLRGSISKGSPEVVFTLRIAKESESGKWSVRMIRMEEIGRMEMGPLGITLLSGDTVKSLVANEAEKKSDQNSGMFPDGREHDFGTVNRGPILKHTFRIVNIAKVPLHIASLRCPGCSFPICGSVSKQVLQPNEEGKLEFTVDTSRFEGSRTVACFLTVEQGGSTKQFTFWFTANSVEGDESEPRLTKEGDRQ